MSRSEIYPWSMLLNVGDYFIIKKDEFAKPMNYIRAMVTQRNYHLKGTMKYAFIETTYGCIVIVAQLQDEVPPVGYQLSPGIYAFAGNSSIVQEQKKSLREKVNLMSAEAKIANLPWWYDSKNSLVFNSKIATKEDLDKWISKERMPGPDEPYPEYYNLDENLQRWHALDDDPEEDEVEEDPSMTGTFDDHI